MFLKTRREVVLGAAATGAALAVPTLAKATQYRENVVPTNSGRISGTIFYQGTGVEVPAFPVVKDHHICGTEDRSPKALRVDDETKALGDVVIEIQGVSEGKPWDDVFGFGEIYQIDCSFQPYVQIIRSNAYVDVFNVDPILHNIHAYEIFETTRRSMFNIAQPKQGQVDRIELNFRRGNILMIDCNAHNWMAAFVYTSSSPYLDVVGMDGKFDISGIPPGSYTLCVWHPMLGEKKAKLDIAPNADLQFDLNLV